ncbi:hypothetical protein C0993_005908 [Termitomyces sp. T159_Od127]|nr:hypothetical protein C0993_005908 [Termitomyces sp. T159_Od127]
MVTRRTIIFAGLNAVRFISIVSLILVFVSTILVMVHNIEAVNAFLDNADASDMQDCDYIEGSTVPNQPAGVFWAVVSSLLILFQAIILFLSEIGWPAPFFDQYFPVLGQGFGLGALGIFQCLISTQILAHHVDDFALVSAFFLFAIGCVNMLLGLIFRASAKEKRSISAFRSETKPILPAHTGESTFSRSTFVQRQFTGEKEKDFNDRPDTAEFNSWKSSERAGYGFGRQGEKAAGLRGFILQPPEESLPRYASPAPSQNRPQHEENHSSLTRSPSVASSSSSFASPHRESMAPLPVGDTKVPSFKSSPIAF